jgi:hypothetical protein
MTSTMMRSLATEQGARCCRQWVSLNADGQHDGREDQPGHPTDLGLVEPPHATQRSRLA